MPRVILIDPQGVEHHVDGAEGHSIMAIAVQAGVPGIVGECGGSLSCASCHVYVDEDWCSAAKLRDGAEPEAEEEMLEFTASPRQPNSRLSCQIKLSTALDGIRVRVAPEQF